MTKKNRPQIEYVLYAVLATVAIGAFIVIILYVREKGIYCVELNLVPSRCEDETFLDIGLGRLFLKAFLPTFLYCLLHPVVGRSIVFISVVLGKVVDKIYEYKPDPPERGWGDWSANFSILAGALWPLTSLVIPCFLLARIFGALYRSLWEG